MSQHKNGNPSTWLSHRVTGIITSTPARYDWGGGHGFQGLLGQYGGASAAYSLRRLGPYSGPVVRLRRASDNEERDFSEGELTGSSEGAELLTNGDFATNDLTGWSSTFGAALSAATGAAVCDGSQAGTRSLQQNVLSGAIGTVYKISFTLSACSDLALSGMLINTGGIAKFSNMQISLGSNSFLVELDQANATFGFYANAGVSFTVDDVSVVEYTPTASEQWLLDNAANKYLRQTADSAYATTWYDQSGSGNDATQATAAAQPLLIRAGVTNTENGKAALSFDGVDDYLETQSFNSSQPISAFTVQRFDAAGNGANTYLWAMNGNDVNVIANFANRYQIAAGNNCRGDGSLYSNDLELFSVMFDSVNSNLYVNGLDGQLDSNDAGTNGLTAPIRIGGSEVAPANVMLGEIQEMIIYPSDQSANRIGIETNINAYYGIWLDDPWNDFNSWSDNLIWSED